MTTIPTTKLHTGRIMPVMGLGTWQLTDQTADAVTAAITMGYRLIDTSGDYGTQPGIAQAIKQSGIDRRDLFIVTKVEEDEDALQSAQKNVSELGLSYADLILIHRPPPTGAGESLWHGLIRAKNEGITKDIGVSNYTTAQIKVLKDISGETPVVNQIEWSPFGYSDAMQTYCRDHDIIIQAYSPLTRAKRLDDPILGEIGRHYEKSSAQILIRWAMQRGTVPIPKANQLAHLNENISVFDFELTPDDMATLNNLNEQYSALGAGLAYV